MGLLNYSGEKSARVTFTRTHTDSLWKVVPLSKEQMVDIHPEYVLGQGMYRICHTDRSGGGYDHFARYAKTKWGAKYREGLATNRWNKQFVVQLYGCPLDCHYCYVTRAGVWGSFLPILTSDLMAEFNASGASVFHLMGGAPAMYMDQWHEIIERLPYNRFFHSDLMLIESRYRQDTLRSISRDNCLYAVNIKGLTDEEWTANTRKPPPDWALLYRNLYRLIEAEVPFYVTFTNIGRSDAVLWRGVHLPDYIKAYHIDLIDYDAVKQGLVDTVPWGGVHA